DITGAVEVRLLVADLGSYSPERVVPVWAAARWAGPGREEVRIPETEVPVKMKDQGFAYGLRAKSPSEILLPAGGKGYTRFRAVVGVEESSLQSDISPNVRFFVFTEKPDMDRLVRAGAESPVDPPRGPFTTETLIARVYRHALGRDARPAEKALARELLGVRPDSRGLADLLWCVTMLPEFQLIR
ncbi:MAG: NPCBM/NEW2 domain-containing protein, partial [Bryobacteraceae bacterium]